MHTPSAMQFSQSTATCGAMDSVARWIRFAVTVVPMHSTRPYLVTDVLAADGIRFGFLKEIRVYRVGLVVQRNQWKISNVGDGLTF